MKDVEAVIGFAVERLQPFGGVEACAKDPRSAMSMAFARGIVLPTRKVLRHVLVPAVPGP